MATLGPGFNFRLLHPNNNPPFWVVLLLSGVDESEQFHFRCGLESRSDVRTIHNVLTSETGQEALVNAVN